MATKLYLRNTQSLVSDYYDMLTTPGAAKDTCVTNVAFGAETQVTKTAGGGTLTWITRPVGTAFTLTTTDISIWEFESRANLARGRYRLFKYAGSTGIVTELGGSGWTDNVVMSTTSREDTWTGNPTDTDFIRGDRIVLKVYVAGGFGMQPSTATLDFNAADGQTGDSFLNINETITFLDRVCICHY